jgi:glutamate synthase domain-containing protein 2
MNGRYHIHTHPAPAPFTYPAKFRLAEGDDYAKYGHASLPEERIGGDPFWTPQIITQIWYQAETGKVPISGAGYGGRFSGPGFDSIWLDMSEIVRPTRDGIHGRETISTEVDIGGRLTRLDFNESGALVSNIPKMVVSPIPIIFDPLPFELPGRGVLVATAKAAQSMGNFMVLPFDLWEEDLTPYLDNIIPILNKPGQAYSNWVQACRLVQIQTKDINSAIKSWHVVKDIVPNAVIGIRLNLSGQSTQDAAFLINAGIPWLHFMAGEDGQVPESNQHISLAIREIHEYLVDQRLRDPVTLTAGGGVAAAEHTPKLILCGADAVAIDLPIIVALGCGLWADVRHPCPVEDQEIEDVDWAAQRLINLMNAWRDQLLEALGAMGMREVRRLRGEMGRAIFRPQAEAAFIKIFGATRSGEVEMPCVNDGELEGDLQWPTDLLLGTAEQARTGKPPVSGLRYRGGRSGGGFDRLRFTFESPDEMQKAQFTEESEVDLTLPLNRREDGRPQIVLPHPWYGGGMSFGSISLNTMLSRVGAAKAWDTFTSTGEGGYPIDLIEYKDHIITQVATGLFGVREETIQRARIVEFKYAQGAKPGLGGHLLGSKVTEAVAQMRQAVKGTSLFSPFPFHSVYSVEDHKKHLDWIKTTNPHALVSVKVSTPTDVDMVAVGSYYAGAHIIHLDGTYGGTGAAPEIAKKNIAMPIEFAIHRVHQFLVQEGIRDEVILMASGGVRTPWDLAKAVAMGADGCVIGTADLVALGCLRLGTCEKDKGCPFGITTTDPELSKLIDPISGAKKIANMYRSWRLQLAYILRQFGMQSMGELRGRTDLLVYLE